WRRWRRILVPKPPFARRLEEVECQGLFNRHQGLGEDWYRYAWRGDQKQPPRLLQDQSSRANHVQLLRGRLHFASHEVANRNQQVLWINNQTGARGRPVSMQLPMDQPATWRENRSTTNARYGQPSWVRMYVMSVTQDRLGLTALMSRPGSDQRNIHP